MKNYQWLQQMDLQRKLTPAIIAFTGLQYQYMAPSVFSDDGLKYVQDNLRILSGFYGILRPFDGIIPYRLGMGDMAPAFVEDPFVGAIDNFSSLNASCNSPILCVTHHKINSSSTLKCLLSAEEIPANLCKVRSQYQLALFVLEK